MKRRDFITLIGSAAGCFFTAEAQQSLLAQDTRGAKIREVGFLYPGPIEASKVRVTAFATSALALPLVARAQQARADEVIE